MFQPQPSVLKTLYVLALLYAVCLETGLIAQGQNPMGSAHAECEKVRLAVLDLSETFGDRYPDADSYLKRLREIEARLWKRDSRALDALSQLRGEALKANPLLRCRILMVKRRAKDPARGIAIPAPHESNSGLRRIGYDNELVILDLSKEKPQSATLFRPRDRGYVGEIDLHFDANRFLFTRSDRESWKLWEMKVDGSDLRQVTQAPSDVDCFDGCYLPDGRIVLATTASYQSVPCWHGRMPVANLYLMNVDGSGMRQLCFDQDIDAHPVVLNNGQVMFNRWDYTGINHIFMRQLMVMNPDGTGQRAVYGSNSWFPNSLFFFRPLPNHDSQLVSILSGYHGVPRMGWLVTLDTSRGWYETDGIVTRISGKGAPIKPVIKDAAVDADWPKFLHPYPLSDKYFLVSVWKDRKSGWAIYLTDVFDNLVLLYEEPEYAMLEPVVIRPRRTPPIIPDRIDLSECKATVYLHDVYAGPGLSGVSRGTVKKLRVLSYHFGYRDLAGSDKIGYGGPWDGMQIEGTIPLEADGSAIFHVPSNTPVAVQPLDAEGKAVQLMRSWFTAMPGEKISCVGCHETPAESPGALSVMAATRSPREIDPWYGPARGFDFAREVQPVLNKHCVACHNDTRAKPDLRSEEQVRERKTWPIGYPDRLEQNMKKETGGRMTYTPAYDALIHYVRRVGIEDTVDLLTPGEYHADTSPLVQMLRKGHQGVQLNREDWDRIITWIDLNAPCHGTWSEVYPIPNDGHKRRMALRAKYGGPTRDPEVIPTLQKAATEPCGTRPPARPKSVSINGWPATAESVIKAQQDLGPWKARIDLGDGVVMSLVRIPAGRFVMGDVDGASDEWPQTIVAIEKPFWIGSTEVTNKQFRLFDASHDSGYYVRRLPQPDCMGTPLNQSSQPVVRVSWEQAMEFCRWFSKKTGLDSTLPTEAQWEYACRAGSATPLAYGDVSDDFSLWANLADATFSRGVMKPLGVHPKTVTQWSGGVPHLVLEGALLADDLHRDGFSVTTPVGSFRPNRWGLHDMHGNATEWTLSRYASYPYRDDSHNAHGGLDRRVVRGGSFFNPPRHCRSAFRQSYHPWQRVFNVGFRIVCNDPELNTKQMNSMITDIFHLKLKNHYSFLKVKGTNPSH